MFGFSGIFYNRVLLVTIIAWFVAQALKVLFDWLTHKKVDWSRWAGSGGMPSSHSSFVSALATAIGLTQGFQSTEFALAFALACIVMYDAAGVRRAAGKQAKILNDLIGQMLTLTGAPPSEKLKELLGHTPFEVIIGCMLGILIALLFV